ncbi:ARM repeat-containing protein [Clavulina sp. PMI_390]|nr:ARM repeat-containing protein [Clavulina sp. PMI_390]
MEPGTNRRIDFLKEKLMSVALTGTLFDHQAWDLFEVIALTGPRYVDSGSRSAAIDTLRALVARDALFGGADDGRIPGLLEKIVKWLADESARISSLSARSSSAASERFALLTWACAILDECLASLDGFSETSSWKPLILSLAILIDSLSDANTKPTMKQSALVQTRRLLRSHYRTIPSIIQTLLEATKSSSSPIIFSSLLGVCVDVSIRLKPDTRKEEGMGFDPLIGYYSTCVVGSRVPVPTHVVVSDPTLSGFVSNFVTADDFKTSLLPQFEKGLIRSPEHVLPGAFVSLGYPPQSNKDITIYNDTYKMIATELLSLPKAGKTASPDHRRTLYDMLGKLPTSTDISPLISFTLPALLAKETSDLVLPILSGTLATHFSHVLSSNTPIPADVSSLFKAPVRRAFLHPRAPSSDEAAETLWSESHKKLAEALLPSLEADLKKSVASPLNADSGPMEGYRQGLYDLLALTGTKPSFLLWDKVYVKLSTPEEEQWLNRALVCAFLQGQVEIAKNENLRTNFGLAFLNLAVTSKHYKTRQAALSSLKTLNRLAPSAIHTTIQSALMTFVSSAKPTVTSAEESASQPEVTSDRVAPVLLALADFADEYEKPLREKILARWVVLAHHASVAPPSKPLWVDVVRTAALDPRALLGNHLKLVLETVNEGALHPHTSEAALGAATTLMFIDPETMLPKFLQQIRLDLDRSRLGAITATDLSIWKTEEGVAFIDAFVVLASKKDKGVSKGKNQDIEKWEAQLRKDLAAKKGSTPAALSKQDQALVNAQLRQESEIRARIQKSSLEASRGLGFIRSAVSANVEQLAQYLFEILSLLLDSSLRLATPLVNDVAYQTYFAIASAASPRLGTTRLAIAVATIRLIEIDILPEEYMQEPLHELSLRVLYAIHDRASSNPFDAITFSFFQPFLERILALGGATTSEDDSPLEQITLAMETFQFHVPKFASSDYPRKAVLSTVLDSMAQYAQLARTSATVLVDIGETIHSSATSEETSLLIHGVLAQESFARHACLQALEPFDLTDLDWSPALWIACFDPDEQNAQTANDLWAQNALDVATTFIQDLLPYLSHENANVRQSCAVALSASLDTHPEYLSPLLVALKELYRVKAEILGPQYDAYGMLIEKSLETQDAWPARQAIGSTLEHLAEHLTDAEVVPLFNFLIKDAALGDRTGEVRRTMLAAGSAVVDLKGKDSLAELLGVFESYLGQPAAATEASDFIREAVVILLGRLARHLDSSDPRVPVIVDRLVEALKTPSEAVQLAVAECLGPLAVPLGDRLGPLIEKLFSSLTSAPKYGERRGAAYGLAGLTTGRGLSVFKEHQILIQLKAALDNKKSQDARQGAMFAFETLSTMLGRLFEPYVLDIVPLLLNALGDQTPDVREATQDAAKVIMANMSGFCVKSVLPSLLEGLDEKQWRTKKGSIELLGSMAYLAPRQLSLSLPTVIPRLTGVLTDSHAQVRAAANKSLKQFGEVINNPEIRSLVPTLLKAFVDPDKISNALSALLKKSFVHYIDSPSLALLIPILERGMRERGSENKRKAARIVGNLASLTDSKDFVPYLSRLMPFIHIVLVDPVPEARATAAKALGSLIERLGEANFPDLVQRLVQTLKTDTSGVDRQGAAQGLSEVLSGLGMDRMEALLPEVIANASSPRPYVREGFMSLLVFLPATFGHRFTPHLSRIIPPILNGLADVEEYVRSASMKAGRMIIVNYSDKAVDLLLPELESGMFDSSWRIRHSSITLVGELLFKVSGISGKNEIDEDEAGDAGAVAAENSRKALGDSLGRDRRDRILGSLYIVRQDAVASVRQAALHIWKALVHNTPRTVREILVTLVDHLVALLAEGEEQRETAARTLGEISRKLGEKILGEVVPLLRRGADSPNPSTRAGVCFAVSEILQNTTDSQQEGHEDDLIATVRVCLVDESSSVRVAAAQAFDTLQEYLGNRAIDQTIPTLLEALRRPGAGSGTALQALREIMTVRATTVFPILIPTLVTSPMTVFNANALASLVTVAGSALSKRLVPVVTGLITSLETEQDAETVEAVQGALEALVGSIDDIEGLHSLMMLLLGWCKHETPIRRGSACSTFAVFCANTDLDFSTYRVDWIRQLVSLLDDRENVVHEAAWKALDEFVKSIDKDEMDVLVVPLRRTIESTGAPGRNVPGFSLPKGVAPILPIITAGLTGGNNEQREHASYSIADVIERTEESAIKPYITQLTGALIRVITQATTAPPPVKGGILHALTVMLQRIPTFVKPFFPQLQRTFVKSLSDAALSVRLRAVTALTALMVHQPRVDPLITELVGAVRSNDDAIAGSIASALGGVVTSARKHVSAASAELLLELVSDSLRESHEGKRGFVSLYIFVSAYLL